MLLKSLTTDIQWQVIRVHNTMDKGQVLGHHVFKVVGDEDTPYIQLNLVHRLAILRKEVVRGRFGYIQD